MKKVVFALFGLLIVNLSASIFKITVPLDIDGFGNNQIVHNNQSYAIDSIKIHGDVVSPGGHWTFPIGSKTIILGEAGVHETVTLEREYPQPPDHFKQGYFIARVAFCSTSNNKCFIKVGAELTPSNTFLLRDTNLDTFTLNKHIRSTLQVNGAE